MSMSVRSTQMNGTHEPVKIKSRLDDGFVITLAGNPNVGKSTVFNGLTGLNQHTGNWPGKTVANARGKTIYKGKAITFVDVPGTYSLLSNSVEEQIARNFICFGNPDVTVVVTDATCLERNLNLVLQILEMTPSVVVCVNLIDEARKKKIRVDLKTLEQALGVPVVGTNARSNQGLDQLLDSVWKVATNQVETNPVKVVYPQAIEQAAANLDSIVRNLAGDRLQSRWVCLKLLEGDEVILKDICEHTGCDLLHDEELMPALEKEKKALLSQGIDSDTFRDMIVSGIIAKAEETVRRSVTFEKRDYNATDRKIDRIVTSRIYGIPIMLALLGFIFWLTVTGTNYPSEMLASGFSWLEGRLSDLFVNVGAPVWLHDMLVLGMYRTLAWVVSVMLPPMAIFFPLFTLLEDLGYLPRVAFNLDNFFQKACSHGKQSLTMCMGFGCNAAGVVGCRIIDSPRERLIAIITNNFVPCNGRFPTLIAITAIFFSGAAASFAGSLLSAAVITVLILFGILMTFFVSKLLSKTILKGVPSSFALELPPYRTPQIGRILVRSILDRTLFVLGRAVTIALPAGLVIWALANIQVGGISLLARCAGFLDPFAYLIGMDGYILMAFILGLPANEIVLPIVLMSYMQQGHMTEYESLAQLAQLLTANGWTGLTAICVMLFSLMHFPCGTTLWTIRKETLSTKWTLVSFLIPTLAGLTICFVVATVARLFGWA